MAATQTWQPLERDALAARLAQDIPEGWSVNLGIGIPTLVGNYVPPEREVIFHSENGILGMGPAPPPEKINRWLINASSQYVTLRPGASYMSHSDSFALVRGGHLDLCVLGAFQVGENGDLANWARSEDDKAASLDGFVPAAVATGCSAHRRRDRRPGKAACRSWRPAQPRSRQSVRKARPVSKYRSRLAATAAVSRSTSLGPVRRRCTERDNTPPPPEMRRFPIR